MSPATNSESMNSMRWVLENARNGFYLYTTTPAMQRRVAEHFGAYGIAVYDYGRNNAPYSFADLAKWAFQQKAKIFFVINMQIALQEENDMINLNLSRDFLTKIDAVWVFGMTPDTDNRLVKIAIDFYSFIRLQLHFEDDYVAGGEIRHIEDATSSDKYYDPYDEAKEQLDRYSDLCKELLALPMDAEPERLLSAAMTLENIADHYFNYGNYSYAMKLYTHIKEIRENALGKEHPDTAGMYYKIALVYDKHGDYPKALELYCMSYRILLHAFGESHPDVITVKSNMKAAYFNTGASESFEEWFAGN